MWNGWQIESGRSATALEHNLVLITRNLRDVAALPLTVVNPWQGMASRDDEAELWRERERIRAAYPWQAQ